MSVSTLAAITSASWAGSSTPSTEATVSPVTRPLLLAYSSKKLCVARTSAASSFSPARAVSRTGATSASRQGSS